MNQQCAIEISNVDCINGNMVNEDHSEVSAYKSIDNICTLKAIINYPPEFRGQLLSVETMNDLHLEI
jgi:hypothetical protein